MPQHAAYTLKWWDADQIYRVSTGQGNEALDIVPESPAWEAWLQAISSFAFHGKIGSYTARKERKPRGEGYWYAYARIKGKMTRRYLSPGTGLKLARLEQVAYELATYQQPEEGVLETGPLTSSSGGKTPSTAAVEEKTAAPAQSPPTPLVLSKVQAPRLR